VTYFLMFDFRNNAGFSLIETFIAITLGLIILTGVMQVYLNFKKTYANQNQLIAAQENGRTAIMILTNAIHTAGYTGCEDKKLFYAVQAITNTNQVGDGIVIKTADNALTKLTTPIETPTTTIEVTANPADKDDPDLLIADCTHAQLFQATSFGSKIKTNITIEPTYQILDTEVGGVTTTSYYVKPTSRINPDGEPIFALYSITNGKEPEELVEGIDNLQIEYGASGHYLTGAQVTNWDEVQSVHLILAVDLGKGETKSWETFVTLRN
jgi:type IV pilus assembly protein PilW